MTTRRFSVLTVLLVLVLAATSCAAPPATAPTAAPAEQPAAPAEQPLRITYMPQNTGNPYFERINFGFQETCKELGCQVTFTAPATADATSQIPFIQEQVQRGIDVLAIQPNSVDALNAILDDVRARGILVITTNNDLTGNESHRDASVMAVDFSTVGRQMLESLYQLTGGQGKFAIISATTDAPAQREFIEEPQGVKDLLQTDPKYKDLELLEVVYGDDVPQKSLTECEALLAKYPDLDAIMAPTTVAVASAAQCVESAGVYPGGPNAQGRGVIVYGLGLPNQMSPFLKSGVVELVDLWDPANMGVVAVHLAKGLKDGSIQLGEGNSFEVPGLGTMTFGPDNVIIVGAFESFNKDNVDDFGF